MKTSLAGRKLVIAREGVRLTAYSDPGPTGLPVTIGVGCTRKWDGSPWSLTDRITMQEAESYLERDLEEAEGIVNKHVTVPLNQGQFDALVSFVFNVGHGRPDAPGRRGKDGFVVLRSGRPSTMLRKLNAGDYAGAADEFGKWTLANGVRLNGLVKRRESERQQFEMGGAAPAVTEPVAAEPPVEKPVEKPVDQPGTGELVTSIWKALRSGYKLVKYREWKQRQNLVNGGVVIVSGLTVAARYFGYEINIPQEDLVTLVGALAVVVGLFNNVATTATTSSVGLRPKGHAEHPGEPGPGDGRADPISNH